jgi:hypothetical protein
VSAALIAFTSASLAASARADGDPASDVLATQSLFLPQDAGVPPAQQAQLGALLEAAGHSGYRLRVALIASSADLGSVTELWRMPRQYAQFLGQELSLIYHGSLLVVMPNGYGLYRIGGSPGDERSARTGLGAPSGGLGSATLAAIQRLASASGHPLALTRTAAASTPAPSSAAILPWIVFALGGALIVLAWIASFRARPLRAQRP